MPKFIYKFFRADFTENPERTDRHGSIIYDQPPWVDGSKRSRHISKKGVYTNKTLYIFHGMWNKVVVPVWVHYFDMFTHITLLSKPSTTHITHMRFTACVHTFVVLKMVPGIREWECLNTGVFPSQGRGRQDVWSNSVFTVGLRYPDQAKHNTTQYWRVFPSSQKKKKIIICNKKSIMMNGNSLPFN